MAENYYPSQYVGLHTRCPSSTAFGNTGAYAVRDLIRSGTLRMQNLARAMFGARAEHFGVFVDQLQLPNDGRPTTLELPAGNVGEQRRAVILLAGSLAAVGVGCCEEKRTPGEVCVTVVGDTMPQTYVTEPSDDYPPYTIDTRKIASGFNAFSSDTGGFGMTVGIGYNRGCIAVMAARLYGPSIAAVVPII